MRQWVTPRSLMLHGLFIIVAGGCLIAAWWQVHRAMQGNTLSYLYSVEWPAFAVVAGIGWWQMFHDTPEDLAERKAFHHRMRAASTAVVARTLPRSARAITVGSQQTSDARVLENGIDGPVAIEASSSSPGGSTSLVPIDEADLDAVLMETESLDVDPDDPLAVYNRYLAMLALHGKPKTWRNPKGV